MGVHSASRFPYLSRTTPSVSPKLPVRNLSDRFLAIRSEGLWPVSLVLPLHPHRFYTLNGDKLTHNAPHGLISCRSLGQKKDLYLSYFRIGRV